MPYKNQTLKLLIPRELDSRIKLTEEERQEIRDNYGKISQRKLAKIYNVSRRLIIFVGCPEKYEKSKEQRRNRRYYYSKDKINAYVRKTRHKRQELYLKGELEKMKR